MFDDRGHTCYRTDADVMGGFNGFLEGRTNKWSPRRACVRKDMGYIKYEYG